MKTPLDPRHLKREKMVKLLFAWSFDKNKKICNPTIVEILQNIDKIDEIIAENAPEWPISQVNKTDLAILRLAVFELIIKAKEPAKVIIDEAVELGKKFGSEKSPNFINGVLGTILKKNQNETTE